MNDRVIAERRRAGLVRGSGTGELGVLYVCLFVVMAGYGSTLVVLPDHIQRIDAFVGASADFVAFQVGLLTGVYALAQLVAGPVVGRLADRVGYRAALLGGLIGLAATQAAFALVTPLFRAVENETTRCGINRLEQYEHAGHSSGDTNGDYG